MGVNLMHNPNVVEVPIIHSYNLVDLALFLNSKFNLSHSIQSGKY